MTVLSERSKLIYFFSFYLCLTSLSVEGQSIFRDPNFGENGVINLRGQQLTQGFGGRSLNIAKDNNLLIGGGAGNGTAIQKRNPLDGSLITSFGEGGLFRERLSRYGTVQSIFQDVNGNIFGFGHGTISFSHHDWSQIKLSPSGVLDDSYKNGADHTGELNPMYFYIKAFFLSDNSAIIHCTSLIQHVDENGQMLNQLKLKSEENGIMDMLNDTVFYRYLYPSKKFVIINQKFDQISEFEIDQELDYFYIWNNYILGESTNSQNQLLLYDLEGKKLESFSLDLEVEESFDIFRVAFFEDENAYLIVENNEGHIVLIKIDITGSLDKEFGINGQIIICEDCFYYLSFYKHPNGDLFFLVNGGSLVKLINTESNSINTINGEMSYEIEDVICNTEQYEELIKFEISNDQETRIVYSNSNGSLVDYLEGGDYTIEPIMLPEYMEVFPQQIEISVDSSEVVSDLDFCFKLNSDKEDLELYTQLPEARIGFNYELKLRIKNKLRSVDNATIKLEYDKDILQFLNSSIPFSEMEDGIITFFVEDLTPQEKREISVEFYMVNDIALLGETVSISGEIYSTGIDCDVTNNSFDYDQPIIGSYDPNDITVFEGPRMYIENKDQYLNYMIRFQNTGTASAVNIDVSNELDSLLDWDSFQVLEQSHEGRTVIREGNKVNFIFDNIYLPDSTTNLEESQGYILYKIKPITDLLKGDSITNEANIYFDFNSPIKTNTVFTKYIKDDDKDGYEDDIDCDDDDASIYPGAEEIPDNGIDEDCDDMDLITSSVFDIAGATINIYPNPVKDILNIDVDGKLDYSLKLYDIEGKLILEQKNSSSINTASINEGLYFLEIQDVITNQKVRERIIVIK